MPRRSFQLVLAFEADRPLAGGARWSLDGVDEIRVGRGAERTATRRVEGGCTILQLSIPGRSVSSKHARIGRARGSWEVEDLGSRNGTLVNAIRVERAAIGPSDVIDFGRSYVLLRDALVSDGESAHCAPPPGTDTLATLVPAYAARLRDLARVAASSIPMLLLGETGTGKEVVARAIHTKSARSGRFVAVNCGALSEGVLASQLFGHTRGAFSGALRDEPGLVRESDGGTLFLDEIGEMPLAFQVALLRVLQDGEVLPVGGTRPVKVDLRVVAATNRPLRDDVAAGRFRADLLARLSGFSMSLPPLRERREDLGVLVATLLQELAPDRAEEIEFAADAAGALFSHDWPHNVRELRQALATALVLAADERITLAHLPAALHGAPTVEERPLASSSSGDEDERVRVTLLAQLRAAQGNVAAVARSMGKAPMQIHRWMKRFGIDPNDHRG